MALMMKLALLLVISAPAHGSRIVRSAGRVAATVLETDTNNVTGNDVFPGIPDVTFPWESKPSFVVSKAALNDDAHLFTGPTAYEAYCANFWSHTVRSKIYIRAGCTPPHCSSITFDCNDGPGEGVIGVKVALKGWFGYKTMQFAVYKDQKSNAQNRFLLFDQQTGGLVLQGCAPWMQGTVSWCEGAKWSKKEDDKLSVKGDLKWDMTYHWLSFESSTGTFVYETDKVSGSKKDELVKPGLVTKLGEEIGLLGPDVGAGESYTIGADSTPGQACFDNDKNKGESLPLQDDTSCNVNVYKFYPDAGNIVKSKWSTTHYKTEVQKVFSA